MWLYTSNTWVQNLCVCVSVQTKTHIHSYRILKTNKSSMLIILCRFAALYSFCLLNSSIFDWSHLKPTITMNFSNLDFFGCGFCITAMTSGTLKFLSHKASWSMYYPSLFTVTIFSTYSILSNTKNCFTRLKCMLHIPFSCPLLSTSGDFISRFSDWKMSNLIMDVFKSVNLTHLNLWLLIHFTFSETQKGFIHN